MPLAESLACVRCGDTVDRAAAPSGTAPQPLCRACRLAQPPFERALAYGLYNGRLRDAVHALKYQRMQPAARKLGQMLARAAAQVGPASESELLVIPVPLHRSKYRERKFNQAQLLAVEAIRSLRKTRPGWRLRLLPQALVRVRATGSQAGLTPNQRRKNLRGAFRVADPAAVAGRQVLLIDDIMTTGATARTAARALVAAGAERVWVATLARARRIAVSTEWAGEKDQPSF